MADEKLQEYDVAANVVPVFSCRATSVANVVPSWFCPTFNPTLRFVDTFAVEGVEDIIQIDFDKEEKAAFDQSAEAVNSLISAMKKILAKLTWWTIIL